MGQIKKQHIEPLPGYFQDTRDGVELELVIMLLHGRCQQLDETLFWKGRATFFFNLNIDIGYI